MVPRKSSPKAGRWFQTSARHAPDEQAFRLMFDGHSAVMLLIEPETGEILNANQAAVDFYGYPKSKLCGMSINKINTLPSGHVDDERQKAFNEKQNHFVFPHRLASGEKRIVEVHSSPIVLQDKRVLFSIIHDITERKRMEEELKQQNVASSKLNRFSVELSILSSKDNLEVFIARQVKELTGATAVIFSEYNHANRTTTAKHIEMEPGLLEKVVSLLGRKVQEIHTVVSDEMYREMTTELVGMRETLYEMSFGAIPRPVGAAIQALLKVDRFIGIAYLIEGKLYGTSTLAMSVDQPDPPKNIVENFASLAAVSLRRKQSDMALFESEARYRAVAQSANEGIVTTDSAGRIVEWNRGAETLFGHLEAEVRGQPLSMLMPSRFHDEYLANIARVQSGGEKYMVGKTMELKGLRKDGSEFPAEHSLSEWQVNDDRFYTAIIRDITERKQMEQALRESEEKHRILLEKASDPIFSFTLQGQYKYVNRAFANGVGKPVEDIIGKSIWDIFPKDEADKRFASLSQVFHTGEEKIIEVRVPRADGDRYYVTTITPIKDMAGEVVSAICSSKDITARKQAEAELRRAKDALEQAFIREQYLARTDMLTGINNRGHLFELAQRELDVAARYQQPLTVMMFDIDDFKQINDILGHAMGDQALKNITQNICTKLRSADLIGRYGGDEFVILLPQTSTQEALYLAERIHASIAAIRMETDKDALTLAISIGIAQTIHDAAQPDTVENLFLRADQALYAAKKAGKNCTLTYSTEMQDTES